MIFQKTAGLFDPTIGELLEYYGFGPNKEINKMKKDLAKLRKFVEKNFEYVGENFPREVRKIYYDKKRNKNIYGITTPKEAQELKVEGIDVDSIPWVNNKEN